MIALYTIVKLSLTNFSEFAWFLLLKSKIISL